jgi:hypothetical protein
MLTMLELWGGVIETGVYSNSYVYSLSDFKLAMGSFDIDFYLNLF